MLVSPCGTHPVMMGPIMIHKQKKFKTYHFFASSLVGLKPSLCDLKAFGTDGEGAISKAMHVVFDKAIHLRCFLHFRGNLDSKLREWNVPRGVRIKFLRDVFGNPSDFHTGIVDADSEDEFDAMVDSLVSVWNEREKPFHNPPAFHAWFVKNCKDEVKTTMLKSRRVLCGLGNPPDSFYTNDVEAQNAVIKHQTQYKAQELPTFVETVKKMINRQKKEIEKAVAGLGEYQFSEEYKSFEVPARKFVQMTNKQKEKHLKSFLNAPLIDDTHVTGPRKTTLMAGGIKFSLSI